MGKNRRLNKFISKWIKSDLPRERPTSTVLLLGVTRLAASPPPARRPCSLPPPGAAALFAQARADLPPQQAQAQAAQRVGTGRGRPGTPAPASAAAPAGGGDSGADGAGAGADADAAPTPPPPPAMDRSVDSIGACSLDANASADLSDWSEVSSVATLRSASILTPRNNHLPSYLSLACSVNGYSTTTNYDPERLARSRDASPHRIEPENLTANKPAYTVQNNLLSPPNLVPLPDTPKMAENTIVHHHQEFYTSTKTLNYISSESHFTSNIYDKDSIDACLENGHHSLQTKCISFESKNMSIKNQSKCMSETSMRKEFTNGKETKSFIQQRVERLYGPGALAQGFFVMKRQKNQLSDSDDTFNSSNISIEQESHSKSMTQQFEDNSDLSMKQSTSSPTLPVLRHLRPEFRAQLPIISPRKGAESPMLKSATSPKLKVDMKVNGHLEESGVSVNDTSFEKLNGVNGVAVTEEENSEAKDGHYFLKILETQNKRLLGLADAVEEELTKDPELPEEIIGKLRSASGKARLLVSQKMQQFKGLCTNNINQVAGEAFPTTNEDLQGFWDMVMLQVDQVDTLFKEINALKKNNWKEVKLDKIDAKTNGTTVKPRRVPAKVRPTSAVNEEARKQREEQRKKIIEERRKAMKAKQSKPSDSIEIFVPESS